MGGGSINDPQLYEELASDQKPVLRTKVKNSASEPVPVYITDSTGADLQSHYGEALSVSTSVTTTIVSHTVPAGKTFLMKEVEVGGTNIATYTVEIGATVEAKKRTYFTYYNERFNWHGFEVAAGSVISVKVVHSRALPGDFEARIIGDEI